MTVFFVISGYLITTLILKEISKTGKVSLSRFYFRRTMRILPPFYFLILAVILRYKISGVPLPRASVLHALTYTTNYNYEWFWYLVHSWSLSVEEQFYVLWPATLLLLGRRKAFVVAGLLLLICPFVRLYYWTLPASLMDWTLFYRFESVADAIAVGCLLAGLHSWLHRNKTYNAILNSRYFFIIPLIPFFVSSLDVRGLPYLLIGITLQNVSIALTLDWVVTKPQSYAGRVLNWRPIAYIGVISYSLYLWQQLFMPPFPAFRLTFFPYNLIATFIMALFSYYLVERPSLTLRQKWEKGLFGQRQGNALAASPLL